MAGKPWVKEAIDAIQDTYIKGLVKTLDKYLTDDAVAALAKYVGRLEKKVAELEKKTHQPGG